jgi:linoleate 9S-lipoxygenase
MFTDPKSESRSGFVYLTRDESFGHEKSSDFLAFILKSASQSIIPSFTSIVNKEFNNFEDVRSLYDGGVKLPTNFLSNISPIPLFTELFRSDGAATLKFSPPKVVQGI